MTVVGVGVTVSNLRFHQRFPSQPLGGAASKPTRASEHHGITFSKSMVGVFSTKKHDLAGSAFRRADQNSPNCSKTCEVLPQATKEHYRAVTAKVQMKPRHMFLCLQ